MTLSDIIRIQREKAAAAPDRSIDWARRRAKWLSELDTAFARIKDWLLASGLTSAEIEPFEVELSEETLGRYVAPGLRVRLGAAMVTFRPVGAVLIGACGRVDVTSDQPGTPSVKLIAEFATAPDDSDQPPSDDQAWVWLVYPARARDGGYPLDQEGLARTLAIVLGEAASV